MINIQKFVAIRKKQKISQSKLAEGICTQATLSKFENNGQVPAFKILEQLCARLQIEVGDIMLNSQNNELTKKMMQAEFAFIDYDYEKIFDLISSIDEEKIKNRTDRLHFDYLRGLYALEGDRDQMTALFYFNNILTQPHLDDDNIYRLLALKGCSQVYDQRKDLKKAKYYYQQILDYVMQIKISDNLSALQVLSILYHAGNFYGKNGDYQKSNYLLNYAYQVGKRQHVVYYMARILYRLGNNDVREKKVKKRTIQRLNDACAFARFNHNQVTLNRTKKLLQQIGEVTE
ncbi:MULTISPECIES: helix-turn-helix domain-containing protein [Lactobacillus]|uniref:XRE family transcriptional regulator n=1 Tax=Lactobacillus xujianguonis TaxID=2495899 RepID=A0A437ST62_9LACO|nr:MULTISPECIES: helix-turn-helix transcriptional regulator [Lactobacillus]RVU70131.1 XRE family transcriptional regulator [Lactobacillus xujianguonis]RVU73349.1 XRE family transcriptional regulator [Lactobacillus xujianguonis]